MALSGSAVFLGVAVGPSVGHARFELFLPLPTDYGVAVLGAEV